MDKTRIYRHGQEHKCEVVNIKLPSKEELANMFNMPISKMFGNQNENKEDASDVMVICYDSFINKKGWK